MVLDLIKYIIICLIMTEILELVIIRLLGVKNKNNFIVVFLMNLVTNIALSYITYMLSVYKNINFYEYIFMAEIIVIVVESVLLDKYFDYEAENFFVNKITKNKKLKSVIFSLIINVLSIVVGSAFVQMINVFNM